MSNRRKDNLYAQILWVAQGMLALISCVFVQTSDAAIAQSPLFLTTSVPPIVMLTLGKDHKLFFEAYNDASDLTGDGGIDVGYKPSIDYFGYFDSHRCYSYDASGVFLPEDPAPNKICSGTIDGEWSGDFLNYLTTSRMDALRKVLYGGYRTTDTTTQTILTRAFIPEDAHTWGKEYNPANSPGYSITDYTPLSEPVLGTQHLFISTTLGYGQPTLLRVLNDTVYRVWEWVSIERPVGGVQCATGNNNRANCAVAGGTSWPVVPNSVVKNLVRTTYDLSGTGGTNGSHPSNHAGFVSWLSTYAVAARKFGSGSMDTISTPSGQSSNNNPYGSGDYYMTVVTGTITVPTTGSYTFAVDGDDAIEVIINNTTVAGWYGGHGTCNCTTNSGSIFLTAGTVYPIQFNHEEQAGGDSFVLRWQRTFPDSNITDYSVNVSVCQPGKLESNCKAYVNGTTTTYKPTGLLQTYGEQDLMAFGLLSGSYKKNLSGGGAAEKHHFI